MSPEPWAAEPSQSGWRVMWLKERWGPTAAAGRELHPELRAVVFVFLSHLNWENSDFIVIQAQLILLKVLININNKC